MKLSKRSEKSLENTKYFQKLCLDIGGYKISSALIDNKIIKKYTVLTEAEKGKSSVLRNITKAIDKVYDKRIISINVAAAGPFKDFKKGILDSVNLPLKNFNLKKFLYKKYKKNVKIDNDAKCFALGEAVFGAGKKYDNILGITLGTGIGGGIIINKKIYHGRGNASEIGHMIMNFRNDIETIFQKLKSNGEIRSYKMLGYYLGHAIVNYIHILDPDIIIIGGGISKHFNEFEKEMNSIVRKKCMFEPCKIVKAKLKDSALLGASLL